MLVPQGFALMVDSPSVAGWLSGRQVLRKGAGVREVGAISEELKESFS